MNQSEILVREVEKRMLLQIQLIMNEAKTLEEANEKIKALINKA